MGFLEMIGFALYHAIKEEAEEERRRENLFEKLDKAESDFSSFCSILFPLLIFSLPRLSI